MENTNNPNQMQLEFAQRIEKIQRQHNDQQRIFKEKYESNVRCLEIETNRKINEVKMEHAKWQDEYHRQRKEAGKKKYEEMEAVAKRLEDAYAALLKMGWNAVKEITED